MLQIRRREREEREREGSLWGLTKVRKVLYVSSAPIFAFVGGGEGLMSLKSFLKLRTTTTMTTVKHLGWIKYNHNSSY